MPSQPFRTADEKVVSAVTADEMREVDRIAVEEFGIGLLQMMENAGRTLAWHVRDIADETASGDVVTVIAGNGGNGGGGLAAARHLANRDLAVTVVLDRPPGKLDGAARHQYETLAAMGVPVAVGLDARAKHRPAVVVDALVGYGLDGPLRGTAADLVRAIKTQESPVVSLDVPSGVNATTGEQPGETITPTRTLTLALPKTGLRAIAGRLFLADIAIPKGVFRRVGIEYESPFEEKYWVELEQA